MTTITKWANKGSTLTSANYDGNIDRDVTTQTGGYTADVDDNRSIVEITTTGNFNLPAISTVLAPTTNASDYRVTVKNLSGGTVTLDGNGTETIDGEATFDIADNYAITVQTNSSEDGWNIIDSYVVRDIFTSSVVNGKASTTQTAITYGGTDDANSATEAEVMFLAGVGCRAKNLHVYIPSGGNTLSGGTGLDVTVRSITAGGSSSATTITVNFASGADGLDSDTSHTHDVGQLEYLSIEFDATGATSGIVGPIMWSLEMELL